MSKASKRYAKAAEMVDASKRYALEEAVELLLNMPKPKFDETVELSARLGADPKQGNQVVRGTVSLPHGSGKNVVVIAFTEDAAAAKAAGADHAGLADLIKKVSEGWMDFDVAISTVSAMKEVRTIARQLGPRGLMPNPKSGTVTDDVAKAISEVKAGRVEFKMDKTANCAMVAGKRSFTKEQLVENLRTAVDSLAKAKPEAFKGGDFIKGLAISGSMSPSIRLDVKALGAN